MSEFSSTDLADLIAVQPGLYVSDSSKIAGTFSLNAVYEGVHLQRDFQIEALAGVAAFGLPAIEEVGGESKRIMKKYALEKSADLHINVDGTICIGVPGEVSRQLPNGRPLKELFASYVTPYFYGLAFFDDFGRWPWRGRSHGVLGVMEYYSQIEVEPTESDWSFVENMLLISPDRGELSLVLDGDGSEKCPCKSGLAVVECHDSFRTGFGRLAVFAGLERRNLLLSAMRLK